MSLEPTIPMDEFLVKYRKDDNEWWRLESGDMQNLFEEAADRLAAAEKVIEAAKAEVLAQGYRSSDMARALEAYSGEFWFETHVPKRSPLPRCGYSVTVEMDDGPLDQVCALGPHDIHVKHVLVAYQEVTE